MIEWLFTRWRLRCARRWARRAAAQACYDADGYCLTHHTSACFEPWAGPVGEPIGRVEAVEDEHGIRLESLRHLVKDPTGRLFLLGEDGRVNQHVTSQEIDSWHRYDDPAPVQDGSLTYIPPSRYVGIPYQLRAVGWAEFVRLGGPPPGPPNPPRAPHDRPYA